jgi:hypothetical protein
MLVPMSTLTFDTLRYTERLRAAGVPEQQAKAEAEALRDVLAEAIAASNKPRPKPRRCAMCSPRPWTHRLPPKPI